MPFSNSLLYLALACLLDIFNFPTLCLAEWPAWTVLHALGFLFAILILYISPLSFCKKVIDQANSLGFISNLHIYEEFVHIWLGCLFDAMQKPQASWTGSK
jgi:hypothetical protein